MGTILVIVDILFMVYILLAYSAVYKRTQQMQEHINTLNQHIADLHKTNKSIASAGSELAKAIDYLLIRDGAQGVYMGERGDA